MFILYLLYTSFISIISIPYLHIHTYLSMYILNVYSKNNVRL